MLVTIVKKIITLFMAVLCVVLSPMLGNFTAKFEPQDKENVKLNFATISDIHLTTSSMREFILKLGLDDMQNAETPLDAVILAGDITDHGYEEQWESLADAFSGYKPAKNILIATGNHDTWTRSDNENRFKELFVQYNKEIADREIDNMYYSTKVNGYTFIVLGSEDDITPAYLSDAQLQWLSEEMEKASKDNLPIFVVCHQPLNGTHGLPKTWGDKDMEPDDGGMGDQSDAVKAILTKYKNVFLISGHIHSGFTNEKTSKLYGYSSIESNGSFHSINLPSYMYFSIKGEIFDGMGYQFEVYKDKVVVRGRSYAGSVWSTKYEQSIPLV